MMAEFFAANDSPIVWAFMLMLIGASAVLIAKILGLIFLRGKTKHRVGDAMNVSRATVTEWSDGEGLVTAGGELWRASSSDQLNPGDPVVVSAMNGLVLKVKKKKT